MTASEPTVTIERHWRDLVTSALLGSDRRDPPVSPPALADLVDDTARAAPSERMLAQVAACTAVRRAGVLPGPPLAPVAAPVADDRPPCPPAAVERWHHITTSWPVLEDEWMLTLMQHGWRLAPELVPAVLVRHRADAVRRTRAMVAAGAAARWLVEHVPDLAARTTTGTVAPEAIAELPDLPIPPDLAELLHIDGNRSGPVLADAIEAGRWAHPHRAVLVNLLARLRSDALGEVESTLADVDPMSPGHPLATVLADLAHTRAAMLAELGAVAP